MTLSSFTLRGEPSSSRAALLHEGRDTGFHMGSVLWVLGFAGAGSGTP